MSINFITGPEGSGTTALLRAFANHPDVVKGDATLYGHVGLHAAAGAQLIPATLMSTSGARNFHLADAVMARQCLHDNAAALFASQPDTRAIFFKYSTPAFQPRLWPVFLPLFDVPEFRVVVIWRRPLDSIHSAFRRFYRGRQNAMLGFLSAARSYAGSVRHIRWQLTRSPRERVFILHYEALVARPEQTLRALCAFADVGYRSAEQLLPDRGFQNENGKWKESLRRSLVGGRA